MSQIDTRKRIKHRRRNDEHRGEWRFCPWCGEALPILGVCRYCQGEAAVWATACDACWLPKLAGRILGTCTIGDVARLYVAGMTWGEIGKALGISTPRQRAAAVRQAAGLLFEAAGMPGVMPYPDDGQGDEESWHAWRLSRDAGLDRWLRSIAEEPTS